MSFSKTLTATALTAALSTAWAAAPSKIIDLEVLDTYHTGVFDDGASEIVAHDPATHSLFVINAADSVIDVLDMSDPSNLGEAFEIDVASDLESESSISSGEVGGINSVAVHDNLMAVAAENDNKQANGWIGFYSTSGTYLGYVNAGALPDMVTFTHNGQYLLAANEGEPNGNYSNDPEGSVTIVDIRHGVKAATVHQVGFTDFNIGGTKSFSGPVRIAAKANSRAQDLEPEYITTSHDSKTAWVTLQENNAIAIIDIPTQTILDVVALGSKDFSLSGLDASNKDNAINIKGWSIYGLYMPDSIASYRVKGKTYLITANEGDGREYLTDASDAVDCTGQGGFDFDDGDCFHYLDEIRIKDIEDNNATFSSTLKDTLNAQAGSGAFEDSEELGRLKVITDMGLSNPSSCSSLANTGQPAVAGCVYDSLFSFGARSISVWDERGALVADTGDDIEHYTAAALPDDFNSTNDENDTFDDRSDDKGPEPEGVVVGKVQGKQYAFVGLERIGGIMIFDVTEPANPSFVNYYNNRNFDENAEDEAAGDLGPEGVIFIKAENSPIGEPLLVVGNEVSGSTTVYRVVARQPE